MIESTQMMKYQNESKSAVVAYLLGFLSYLIPVGIHKWYLGHYNWALLYVMLMLIVVTVPETALATLCSVIYGVCMLVDVVKTHYDVKKHNENLISSLKETTNF